VIVRFVNIGGIDDHYGLIFLFIIQKAIEGFCGLVIKVIYHLRYNQLVRYELFSLRMLASSTTKPGHHNNAKQIQNMLYDQNMISVAPFHSQYL
jgi:hypothetical protein